MRLILLLSSFYFVVWANCCSSVASAFYVSHNLGTTASTRKTLLYAVSYDVVTQVGYGVSVPKPLGVIFGENPDPYFGLVVDDVSEGLNGGKAGMRIGDQLLSVNGQVVVGKDFDTIMNILQNGPKNLNLVLFRGPVFTLYTILGNKLGDGEYIRDEEDDGEEPVIMDENYEPPRIEVKERKPLTPGDLLKAMGKVGKMMMEDVSQPETKEKKKGGGGFFGIGAETIQLDGDDANTLK